MIPVYSIMDSNTDSGIYALYWEEPNCRVYVGQSINISNRLKQHISKLRLSTHKNYKLQDCYNRYGVPKSIVLERCDAIRLNDREIFWTNEFNSIEHGCNIIAAGVSGGYGTLSGASKYSTRKILRVFSFLYRTNYTKTEIEARTGVSISAIKHIYLGNSHLWLSSQYLIEYELMKARRNKDRSIDTYKDNTVSIINNYTGEIFTPNNLLEFAKQHKLDIANLSKLFNRKLTYYKEWMLLGTEYKVLCRNYKTNPVSIIDPEGNISIITSITEFAKLNKLNKPRLNNLILGKIYSYRGYKLLT